MEGQKTILPRSSFLSSSIAPLPPHSHSKPPPLPIPPRVQRHHVTDPHSPHLLINISICSSVHTHTHVHARARARPSPRFSSRLLSSQTYHDFRRNERSVWAKSKRCSTHAGGKRQETKTKGGGAARCLIGSLPPPPQVSNSRQQQTLRKRERNVCPQSPPQIKFFVFFCLDAAACALLQAFPFLAPLFLLSFLLRCLFPPPPTTTTRARGGSSEQDGRGGGLRSCARAHR